MRHHRRLVAALAAGAVLVAGCQGEDAPSIETARVVEAEVVQTVAAAARLEPAARVTVTAPAGAEIAELYVDDGDVVEEGEPLARLASGGVELQIAQARAAVDAADALAGAASGAGVDLSPILGALRGQLEAVYPPLLEALWQQAGSVENDEIRAALEERVIEAERAYARSRANLQRSEAELRGQAEQATAGQVAAAQAQREQAELALDAAQDRAEDLTVVAPAAGVVELARIGATSSSVVPDLDALAEGAEDLGSLFGGGADAGAAAGAIAVGVAVTPGQPLLTIYDLSGFSAEVEVDEIDVVEVQEGQPVTVLVDAFPDAELGGVVDHVAIAPTVGATGGASYPVSVALRQVPDDVQLRVGLTASAEIEVRRVDGDTVVPTSALLRRGEAEVVHVVRDGIAHEVPVTVVAIGEDTAAVVGEVEAGERVVTTGVETVQDGDEVPT